MRWRTQQHRNSSPNHCIATAIGEQFYGVAGPLVRQNVKFFHQSQVNLVLNAQETKQYAMVQNRNEWHYKNNGIAGFL